MSARLVVLTVLSAVLHGGALAAPLAGRSDLSRPLLVELASPQAPAPTRAARAAPPGRALQAAPVTIPEPPSPDPSAAVDRPAELSVGGEVELPGRAARPERPRAPVPPSDVATDPASGMTLHRRVAAPAEARSPATAPVPAWAEPSRPRAGDGEGLVTDPVPRRTADDTPAGRSAGARSLPQPPVSSSPLRSVARRAMDQDTPPTVRAGELPGGATSSTISRLLGTSPSAGTSPAAGGAVDRDRAGDAPSRGPEPGPESNGESARGGGGLRSPGDGGVADSGPLPATSGLAARAGGGPAFTGAGGSGDATGVAPGGPDEAPGANAVGTGARSGAEGGGQSARTPTGLEGPGAPTAEYSPYLQRLRRQIQEAITYPAAARRRGLAGTVRVEIVIRPTGEIESVALAGSSAHAVLDDEALRAVRALRPLPFPPGLPRRLLRVQLPIVFDFR